MLDRLKQTNRTILFEEFDYENGNSLVQILDNPTVNSKNSFNEKIKELEVGSFEEFLEKFTPKIYETYEVGLDGNPKVLYTTKHKEGAPEIKLTNHAFYKFVNNLYEKKKTSGKDNFEFDYDDVKEILTPESAIKKIEKVRLDLKVNYEKYKELEKTGLPSEDKKLYAKKIKELRKEVINEYQKSPIGLLPVALKDIKEQLNLIQDNKDSKKENSSDKTFRIGSIAFNENGKFEFLKLEDKSSNYDEENLQEESENTNLLTGCIESDFEKNAPDEMKNSFVKGLVVSSYCTGDKQITTKSESELNERKTMYENVYKQSQEAFINTLSKLVEKILGVKTFFEHATINGTLKPKLVVSNCSIERLLMDDETKNKLGNYLKDLSEDNSAKFWFAIIPAIADENVVKENNEDVEDIEEDDPFGDFDIKEEDYKNNNVNKKEFVSLNTAKEMLDLLEKAKIMTFFNFKADEDTGFFNLTKEKILEYKKELGRLNNEYAVFTYPNFTLLPSKENVIKIGENNKKEPVYINLNGIYIESSYVAAGIMVACEQPEFLKSKGYNMKHDLCARFDIEDNDNSKKILTKMNREMSLKWPSDAEKEIIKDSFGFVFCSNEIYYKNNLINNCYVFIARSLGKIYKNNKTQYKKIYKTILKDCVSNYLKTEGKLTKSKIEKFMKEQVRQWTRDAEESDENTITILKKDEDIKYDDGKIRIKFIDDDEIIDELNIEEE